MQRIELPYVLSLTGSLTTPQVEAIHSETLAAVRDHTDVAIDCSNASEMDVAFIQILVAAQRFAVRSGKRVGLAAPPAGLLADALKRCGFPLPKRPTTALADVLSLPST